MTLRRTMMLALVVALFGAVPARAAFVNVDLSSVANNKLSTFDSGFPSGSTTLGGVPFVIPTTGNNMVDGTLFPTGPATIDIKVNIFNASQIFTLINTAWGQFGPNSFLSIEFKGTGGADLTKNLVGGSDVRDWNNAQYPNTINGTSTVNVATASGGQHRLDMQTFNLGSAFAGQTLTDIILTDTGGTGFSRLLLSGITVNANAVPEPSSLALMGMGLVGTIVTLARKTRNARA